MEPSDRLNNIVAALYKYQDFSWYSSREGNSFEEVLKECASPEALTKKRELRDDESRPWSHPVVFGFTEHLVRQPNPDQADVEAALDFSEYDHGNPVMRPSVDRMRKTLIEIKNEEALEKFREIRGNPEKRLTERLSFAQKLTKSGDPADLDGAEKLLENTSLRPEQKAWLAQDILKNADPKNPNYQRYLDRCHQISENPETPPFVEMNKFFFEINDAKITEALRATRDNQKTAPEKRLNIASQFMSVPWATENDVQDSRNLLRDIEQSSPEIDQGKFLLTKHVFGRQFVCLEDFQLARDMRDNENIGLYERMTFAADIVKKRIYYTKKGDENYQFVRNAVLRAHPQRETPEDEIFLLGKAHPHLDILSGDFHPLASLDISDEKQAEDPALKNFVDVMPPTKNDIEIAHGFIKNKNLFSHVVLNALISKIDPSEEHIQEARDFVADRTNRGEDRIQVGLNLVARMGAGLQDESNLLQCVYESSNPSTRLATGARLIAERDGESSESESEEAVYRPKAQKDTSSLSSSSLIGGKVLEYLAGTKHAETLESLRIIRDDKKTPSDIRSVTAFLLCQRERPNAADIMAMKNLRDDPSLPEISRALLGVALFKGNGTVTVDAYDEFLRSGPIEAHPNDPIAKEIFGFFERAKLKNFDSSKPFMLAVADENYVFFQGNSSKRLPIRAVDGEERINPFVRAQFQKLLPCEEFQQLCGKHRSLTFTKAAEEEGTLSVTAPTGNSITTLRDSSRLRAFLSKHFLSAGSHENAVFVERWEQAHQKSTSSVVIKEAFHCVPERERTQARSAQGQSLVLR